MLDVEMSTLVQSSTECELTMLVERQWCVVDVMPIAVRRDALDEVGNRLERLVRAELIVRCADGVNVARRGRSTQRRDSTDGHPVYGGVECTGCRGRVTVMSQGCESDDVVSVRRMPGVVALCHSGVQ